MNLNDLSTLNPIDLTTWARTATPSEIDELRGRLGEQVARHTATRNRAAEQMKRFESKPVSFEHYANERAKADGLVQWYGDLYGVLGDEFSRRGGWTRFYLCTSSNGHVHRGRTCGSLRRTSQLVLLSDYSGTPTDEFVELAGEGACTVCYPNAPVDRRNELAYAVKDREQAERAAKIAADKAAAKDAKTLVVKCENGERPKTVTSVERVAVAAGSRQRYLARKAAAAATAGEVAYFEKLSKLAKVEADTVASCVWALADKLGETTDAVQARIDAKAEKHFARTY